VSRDSGDRMEKLETIIELEQDADGVFKPVAVRKVNKTECSPLSTKDIDLVPVAIRDSPNPQVVEIIRGFDAGMQIFNRIAKAMREGK
jgi:hypothetical protein